MSIILNIVRASALFLVASVASANTVSLSGPGSVNVGDAFQLTVTGDFGTEGLFGGGVLFGIDPALVQVDAVTITIASDPAFTCSSFCGGTIGPNDTQLAWGDFNGLFAPNDPATAMAVIDLTALAVGTAVFTLVNDPNNPLTQPDFVTPSSAVVSGTSVSINSTVVPVPAAVWLFGSGLLGLVGVARRKAVA